MSQRTREHRPPASPEDAAPRARPAPRGPASAIAARPLDRAPIGAGPIGALALVALALIALLPAIAAAQRVAPGGAAADADAGAATGDAVPWSYRYRDRTIALALRADRAVVRLDESARRAPLVALERLAGSTPGEPFLEPTEDDLLGYPGLAELRFRDTFPAAARLDAIRALGGAPGVELASAPFAWGEALLVPRAEIWVVLEPATAHETLAAATEAADLAPLRAFPALAPTWLLEFSGSPLDAFARARELEGVPGVRAAMPNFIRRLVPHGTPDDPLFPTQWSLENTGQLGGAPGSDIGALEAWDIATGASTVRIAILDEGVDVTHPDLVPNLLPGHDAVTASPSPGGIPGNAAPGDAHGTGCAGIAAASGDNALGIAGVCWDARIVPVRVGFGSLWTQDDWIVDGITWAVDQGAADVLNCSFGGGPPSTVEHDAIAYAIAMGRGGLGAPVLCSTGNGDIGTIPYPAAYPETIAVGASSPCDERKSSTSCDGEWWWGSQWGAELDLVAPGPRVTTTDLAGPAGSAPGDYVELSGTSSAAPHVAGAAALLLSVDPARTATEVRQLLTMSARDLVGDPAEDTPGWDPYMGWGRLDILEMLIDSGAGVAPPQSLACAPAGLDVSLSWTNGDVYDSIIVSRNWMPVATLPGDATAHTDLAPGIGLFRYSVRGIVAGDATPRAVCSTIVVGQATDLVWGAAGGPFDGGLAIAQGLLASGRQPLLVDDLADAGSLDAYETIWVNLGIFPAKHVLTAGEGTALADWLLASPGSRALYLEGGDTWFFDPQTAVHPLFGIAAVSDGSSTGSLATISGASGAACDLSMLAYDYIGENQWIDRIAPQSGSDGVLENLAPPFEVMVFRDTASYCTTGASIEIAGLADGFDTREDLIQAILGCWGVPYVADPSPNAPVGLTCTTLAGSIHLAWSPGDTYDQVRVLRNGVLLASLPGTATSFIDPVPAPGLNAYEVRGLATGFDSVPAVCVVPVAQPQNALRVLDAVASIGESVVIDVVADHELPLEGYVFAITYDSAAISVGALTIAGTWFETLGADFFAPNVDDAAGIATVTAMIDTIPPITEAVPAGNDHLILRIEAQVLPTSPFAGTTTLDLPESVGTPPLIASFIENGGTAYAPVRVPGTLMITANSSLRLRIPVVPAPAGGTVEHPVVVDTDRPLVSYGLGIDFDAASLDLIGASLAGTAAAGADFFNVDVDSSAGWLTAIAVLDLDGTFADTIDPGLARPILSLEWLVEPTAAVGSTLDLVLADGLGTPPVPIELVDDAGIAFSPLLIDGGIVVGAPVLPQFRRGDANLDGTVNLPDAITVLAGLFSGGPIVCADAADANDSGLIDIADAIALLGYLFSGGPPPAPPYPGLGTDPTADGLGCP